MYGLYDGGEGCRQSRDTLQRASASSYQAVWQTLRAPVVGSENNYSLPSIQQLSNAGFCMQGLNRESRSCYSALGQASVHSHRREKKKDEKQGMKGKKKVNKS